MLCGYHIWSDVPLIQAKDDDDHQTLEISLICILLLASRDVHFDERMIYFLSDLHVL